MSALSARDRRTLKEILEPLARPVEVLTFLPAEPEESALESVLADMAGLSHGMVAVRVLREPDHQSLAGALGIRERPSLRVVAPGGEVLPVEVIGEPTGYQFGALVQLLAAASRGRPRLARSYSGMLKNVVHNILLEVYVAPTCPHSPQVVRMAQDFALANPGRVFARSIDVMSRPDLVEQIEMVPCLVVSIDGQVTAQHVGMLSMALLARLIRAGERGMRQHG